MIDKCSYSMVKKIFDTCPIGYYLGSDKATVVLDDKAKTSSYTPAGNRITISYPLIQENCERLEQYDIDLEQFVRYNIYHELSHIILTPTPLVEAYLPKEQKDRMNIVEDTRIESIMRDYYMNVDFKKATRCLTDAKHLDYSNPDILKGMTGFWLVSRLGIGTPEMRADFNALLREYYEMSPATQLNDGYWRNPKSPCQPMRSFSQYVTDIENFYAKYFGASAPPLSEEQQQQMLQQLQNLTEGEKGEKGVPLPQEEQEEKAEQGVETPMPPTDERSNALPPMSNEDIKKMAQTVISKGIDGKLLQQLSAIFEHSTIVEKMTSGATNGYSGIFNPRAVTRKDYKFFMHQDTKGDSKGFSKLHLNLFIDVSGSFYRNTDITNKLLNCLSRVEKDNPNFSYDLITINEKAILKKPTEKWIACTGGNQLPLYLKDLYYKAYKHDCVNYNILLFDGDCMSDTCRYDRERQLAEFVKTFDTKLSTIISDRDNKPYFNGRFKSARVIYCDNYVQELIDKIVEVLKIAFV